MPKMDLRLVYSHGNMFAYLSTIKEVARYLLPQYPNNMLVYQRNSKKMIKSKAMS